MKTMLWWIKFSPCGAHGQRLVRELLAFVGSGSLLENTLRAPYMAHILQRIDTMADSAGTSQAPE